MSKYSDIKKAMNIFVKYKDGFLEAGHDVFYGPSLDTEFSEDDIEKIKKLGWFKSDEYDCWACYC